MKIEKQIELVDKYCSLWNEPNIKRRKVELDKIWATNGRYVDPKVDLRGSEELVSRISEVQQTRPKTKIERATKLDTHHDICRFLWRVVNENGKVLYQGLDIVLFSEDEMKIEAVFGFFENLILNGK